ncbi:hypothetical protein BSL78_23985, partial [Apostichopus japonicus]
RWRPFDIDFHLDLQNGHWEFDNIDTLRQLCSDTVNIRKSDDTFKQKYTIMFINIASRHEIPISCLHLEYSSIKFEDDSIILHSGIPLPKLPTVEKIHIAGSNAQHGNTETFSGLTDRFLPLGHPQSENQETLTEKDILNLFRYGMKCRCIKELMFGQLQLPTSVSPEAITNLMKTRNIRVRWCPFDIDFHLDLQNGHWECPDMLGKFCLLFIFSVVKRLRVVAVPRCKIAPESGPEVTVASYTIKAAKHSPCRGQAPLSLQLQVLVAFVVGLFSRIILVLWDLMMESMFFMQL